jgi:hypothetical protein
MGLGLYAAAAAAIGIGGYLLWPSKHDTGDPDTTPQPPDKGEGDTPEAPEQDAEQSTSAVDVPGSPAPHTPTSSNFHPGPYILPAANEAVALKGHASKAARDLYAFLSQQGTDATDDLQTIVLRFQRAHNSDPLAIRLAGRLPRTGVYDPRTSATLTMYTQRPIPSVVSVPPPPPSFRHVLNPNIPGNAAMMGYNLGIDLRRRGVIHDERQRRLIREYQRAINRDPKFPGPAWARGSRPVFANRIKEDGRYRPEVAHALSLQTHGAPLAHPPIGRRI